MKKWIVTVSALLVLANFAACGSQAEPEQKSEPTVPQRISFQEEVQGQILQVDADVEPALGQAPEIIHLVYDLDAEKALFETLLGDGENLVRENEQGNLIGEIFDAGKKLETPGQIYYEDISQNDPYEKSLENNIFEPMYFTPLKPGGMTLSGKEAAEKTGEFLAQYSGLDFRPWNVTASEGVQGCYGMLLQPYFEDIPILSRSLRQMIAYVGERDIAAFQGNLLLKASERDPISDPLSLEQAVERIKTDFADYSYSKTITIHSIQIGYMAERSGDQWLLQPAWVFLGESSGENRHSGMPQGIAFVYQMADGFLEVLADACAGVLPRS